MSLSRGLALLLGILASMRGPAAGEEPAPGKQEGQPPGGEATVPIDLSGLRQGTGIFVRADGSTISIRWPMEGQEWGRFTIDLRPGKPLFGGIALESPREPGQRPSVAFSFLGLDPVYFLTVGSRQAPANRPPDMSPFNVFFDKPASRPHQTHRSKIAVKRARVDGEGRRVIVSIGDIEIGPFRGELRISFYTGSRLVHMEAAVSTEEDLRAVIYDAGLVGQSLARSSAVWLEPGWDDRSGRSALGSSTPFRRLAVRHRTIVLEGDGGNSAIALFPPPHQFQFPRDWSDNFEYAWMGAGHHGLLAENGLGIRQSTEGRKGEAFVPWFNAPPRTVQRLGFFLLLSRGGSGEALRQVLRYTRGDRFPALPGHITFTSHWHMAVAVGAMERRAKGDASQPDFVRIFRDMGVNAVHLADFHGDGHQKDPGPRRLPELEALFEESLKHSAEDLLFIPGEELDDYLGLKEKGKHPGHWMCIFPKPVHWTMNRRPEQPFEEMHPVHGKVYHVGSRADMSELLRREGGLAWTAHPRIKASSWTPDIFRNEDFYIADTWLGAAWKAMPGDLSREKLGERCLDLLDDMSNWGPRKYLVGEVDVFKIDRTHELFGHMNINYLRLDRVPRFDEGWKPILDALRGGRFFVTTGEVLIHRFRAGGKESGESLRRGPEDPLEIEVELEWTFPLRFLEVVSGDGRAVHRERTALPETEPFGKRSWTFRPALAGRKWVRLDAWDIAANGAFTQPVWLEESAASTGR